MTPGRKNVVELAVSLAILAFAYAFLFSLPPNAATVDQVGGILLAVVAIVKVREHWQRIGQ